MGRREDMRKDPVSELYKVQEKIDYLAESCKRSGMAFFLVDVAEDIEFLANVFEDKEREAVKYLSLKKKEGAPKRCC